MSREFTLGWLIGEDSEPSGKGLGYTRETNDKLGGDNASPMIGCEDVACVGFDLPKRLEKPQVQEGYADRYAMADQLDREDRLSFKRR